MHKADGPLHADTLTAGKAKADVDRQTDKQTETHATYTAPCQWQLTGMYCVIEKGQRDRQNGRYPFVCQLFGLRQVLYSRTAGSLIIIIDIIIIPKVCIIIIVIIIFILLLSDSSILPPYTVHCTAPHWWSIVQSLWHHALLQTSWHGRAEANPAPVLLGLQLFHLHNNSMYHMLGFDL